MNRGLSDSRRRLLLEAARCATSQLHELRGLFDQGGRDQVEALRRMRLIRAQLRELLASISIAAADVQIAEAGADLLCTAVRLSEGTFLPSERLEWCEAVLPQASRFEDRSAEGRLLGNYGNILAEAGRTREAEVVLSKRLRIAKESADAVGEAVAQEHMGKLLLRRGAFAEAEPLLNSAYLHARRRHDATTVTRLLVELANARYRAGDVPGSIQLLKERLRCCRKAGDELTILSTHHSLASRLMMLGQLKDAMRNAMKALALAKRLRQPARQAAVLGTIGDIAMDQGRTDIARRNVTAARRIFRRLGHLIMQGNTATSLGLIAQKEGRHRQAVRWFREAIEIDLATLRKHDEATDLGNLGVSLLQLGECGSAIEAYEKRLTVLESIGDERRAAMTRDLLRECYRRQDDQLTSPATRAARG